MPHDEGFSAESVVRPAYELNFMPVFTEGKAVSGLENSLAELSCSHVIIETVKFAEDGDGYIIRLYESEGTNAVCDLRLGVSCQKVLETDMLEDGDVSLNIVNQVVCLSFRPFEIKTLKLVL